MSELALQMTFDDVADELYGLPPRLFLESRQRHADAAREADDPCTAALIMGLRRPSAGAWMSNQLVRWWRKELLEFVELGRALRHATANLDGTDLWRLTDRRKWALQFLFDRTNWLAIEDHVNLNAASRRGLSDTLQAAVCSEDMAAQMLTGRLHQPLAKISWPGLTPDPFRDELARRRAMRLIERSSQPVRGDDDDDERLATVTSLAGRRSRP